MTTRKNNKNNNNNSNNNNKEILRNPEKTRNVNALISL